MSIESLREGDALAYLRLKEQMIPSDCNALFGSGNSISIEPVFIFQDKYCVERNYGFYEAEKLPNFSRFEVKPEERAKQEAEKAAADAAKAARSQTLPGRNWLETRRAVEAANARGLAASSNYTAATQAEIAQGEAYYDREAADRVTAREKHAKSRI